MLIEYGACGAFTGLFEVSIISTDSNLVTNRSPLDYLKSKHE